MGGDEDVLPTGVMVGDGDFDVGDGVVLSGIMIGDGDLEG